MEKQKERIIVFAGDSTTDSEKLNTFDRLGTGYVKLVHDALVAFRPEEKYWVVNAGVSGNTSRDLLARWDEDVLACSPNKIFCMIGVNDVWRRLDQTGRTADLVYEDEYEENLSKMAEKSKAVKDFCFMTPFLMERNSQDEMLCMVQNYAQIMKKVAQKYGRAVLDIQQKFDEFMKIRSGLSICGDRVHPGSIGSLIIARCILQDKTGFCGEE